MDRSLELYRWANRLTVARMVAIPFAIGMLAKGVSDPSWKWSALALLVLMQASDVADGMLARKAKRLNGVDNPLGRMLDPLADKLFINSTLLALTFLHGFPIWVTAVVFGRDFFLIAGWFVRRYFTKITTVAPNVWGKAADGLQALSIFTFLLNRDWVALKVCIIGVVFFTVVSGVIYTVQGLSLVWAKHPVRSPLSASKVRASSLDQRD